MHLHRLNNLHEMDLRLDVDIQICGTFIPAFSLPFFFFVLRLNNIFRSALKSCLLQVLQIPAKEQKYFHIHTLISQQQRSLHAVEAAEAGETIDTEEFDYFIKNVLRLEKKPQHDRVKNFVSSQIQSKIS